MLTTNKTQGKQLSWVNISFLMLTPIIALLGTGLYIHQNGIQIFDFLNFLLFFILTGVAITGGYHRYFAHRAYGCKPILELFYLVFGAGAFQNSALRWASDHRDHHRYVDTEQDPYSIMMGAFYAHMGWIFYKEPSNRNFDNVPDLLKDRLVLWQDRHYLLLSMLIGFVLPLAVGFAVGRPWGGLLWGGFLRIVITHHMTFSINSLAHMVGSQSYSLEDSSRDSWWLAFLSNGEGYHNFHHRFQGDYRNGVRWYHWDPTKWFVKILSWMRITSHLNRTPDDTIFRARLDTDMSRVQKKLDGASEGMRRHVLAQLQSGREALERARRRWAEVRAGYLQVRANAIAHSSQVLQDWKENIRNCEKELRQASHRWRNLCRV
ncbi:MAG: fatty acid desaturase [Elusimicrobia bacterium]|nr:fatty acid desaturase [Elusimicrobiota bacterium]